MADKLYPKGQSAFQSGDLDWDAHTWKIAALPSSYTFSSSHQYVSDLGTIIARSGALASKTNTAGASSVTLDAADATFTAPAAGSTIAKMVLYRDSGADGSSQIYGYWDTFTATATNDNDITVAFNASGIVVITT